MSDITIKVSLPDKFEIDFDQTNLNWCPTVEYNQLFLRATCMHLNHVLQSRGHMLLNDVHDALKIKRTSIGCVVGWTYDFESSPEIVFSMEEYEDSTIKITLNPEGVIYDFI